MTRKDDPVFNVRFVQLVENHACLWNSTLPAYSKKEEIQKAWQAVANETKDTVRNCRERWRTIRSSFLRSLKLSGTSTGRGKRKYYLFKYLQFLIPYTKTRLKNGGGLITAERKAACLPPMTRINHMPMPIVSSDDTKDSTNSELAIAEDDVHVSLDDAAAAQQQQQPQQQPSQHQLLPLPLQTPLQPRLMAIKLEQGAISPTQQQQPLEPNRHFANGSNNNNNSSSAAITTSTNNNNGFLAPAHSTALVARDETQQQQQRSSSAVDFTAFADWIKSKNNEPHRHCLLPSSSPDADQSFLNSLHPYLKEMSGKQNRRFKQKVVALIDAILDNTD